MEIINLKTEQIVPYDRNPRKNEDAVVFVAESIRHFGFKVPIVVDKNNVVVTGHTRLKAAKKLGMVEVPCIRADDLTDEQIRAFRLADNKVAEKADWDFSLLNDEIEKVLSFDMGAFGFEFLSDEEHDDYAVKAQERVSNILNLGYGQYEGAGYYDIPQLHPTTELPEIREWIGFNFVMSDKEPEGKAVHFFVDDYQFERLWNDPARYIDKLSRYACVATPDFSPYGDMPMATQIYNHYRKHWLGAFWQENGITVIPTIRASTDARSFDWYLDGEPENGIVLISSMWAKKSAEIMESFKEEYSRMFKKLNPSKVFLYGEKIDGLSGNIEVIDTFAKKRWGNAKK